MIIGQDFYYFMLSLAVMGFWWSAYSFLHTSKRAWEHKAASVLIGLFIFVSFISVLGIGGNLPVQLNDKSVTLWILTFIVLYAGIKAVDRWTVNSARRNQICKDREFLRQMRKANREHYD